MGLVPHRFSERNAPTTVKTNPASDNGQEAGEVSHKGSATGLYQLTDS